MKNIIQDSPSYKKKFGKGRKEVKVVYLNFSTSGESKTCSLSLKKKPKTKNDINVKILNGTFSTESLNFRAVVRKVMLARMKKRKGGLKLRFKTIRTTKI